MLHFASPASPIDYLELPIQTLKVGSLGTHNALGLAKAKRPGSCSRRRQRCTATRCVHPQQETYWGNVNPIGPRGVYDEAKRFAEAMTMAYHRYHGLDTRIVRIFNTYGPRMRPRDGRVVSNFIVQALNGEPITIYGEGAPDALLLLRGRRGRGHLPPVHARRPRCPPTSATPREYTVHAAGRRRSWSSPAAGRPIEHRPLPQDDPRLRQPDITRARAMLGWEPRVDLRQGLDRTIAFFRSLVGTSRMGAREPRPAGKSGA